MAKGSASQASTNVSRGGGGGGARVGAGGPPTGTVRRRTGKERSTVWLLQGLEPVCGVDLLGYW